MNWEALRAHRYAKEEPPEAWPKGVKPISTEGLSLFGVDPSTGKLYWDGKEIVTSFKLAMFERGIAILAALSAFGMFVLKFGEACKWW